MRNRIGQARQMLSAVATRHRSRAAILIGGLLAIVAVGSVAASSARAQGFFDVFQSMFNAGPTEPTYAARSRVNRLVYATAPRVRRARLAARGVSAQPGAQKAAVRQNGLSRQAICVRLCDGYAFPLGASHKRASVETQEAACQATCPGAETALYVGANGPEDLASATSARGGRSYNSLPTALAYTKAVSKSCVCGAPASARGDLMAVLRDMTLRHGDAVMTSTGFRIFAGLKDSVHSLKDFRPLARSQEIGNKLRGTLQKLEVASLAAAPHDTFVALEAPSSQRLSATRTPGFQALN